MQKIRTFLWFDNQAEEAANFYTSIFKDSKLLSVNGAPEGAPIPEGVPITVEFELAGQEFVGLNGGPMFKFTEAISLYVDCEDQAEVDYYWDRLSEGGELSQCGWLKDRFGLSWQIIPKALGELMGDPDPQKAGRVMEAMLQMQKIDVAKLQEAYAG